MPAREGTVKESQELSYQQKLGKHTEMLGQGRWIQIPRILDLACLEHLEMV